MIRRIANRARHIMPMACEITVVTMDTKNRLMDSIINDLILIVSTLSNVVAGGAAIASELRAHRRNTQDYKTDIVGLVDPNQCPAAARDPSMSL